MDQLVRALGLTLAQLDFADLPYPVARPSSTTSSPPTRLVPALATRWPGMGIDLDAQTNVHLDTEARELKSPRAFCAPVRVPDEIYLVVLPKGGQDDYRRCSTRQGTPSTSRTSRRISPSSTAPRRQRRHRGLRLHLRPPGAQPALARGPGLRDSDDFVRFAIVTTSTSCAATRPSWPTRPSCTRRPALSTTCQGLQRAPHEALQVDVPPESYLADVDDGFYAPATCAPGCWRARCA